MDLPTWRRRAQAFGPGSPDDKSELSESELIELHEGLFSPVVPADGGRPVDQKRAMP